MPRTGLGMLLAVLAQPAAASATLPDETQLTVLFSNDLYGRFRRITCDDPGAEVIDFANLIGAADAVRRKAAGAGGAPPIMVHGGDLIGPKAIARFLLSKGKAGAERITGWLDRAGYDLIAVGNNDFASVPSRLRNYLDAGRAIGLHFSAANLDCEEPDTDICDLVRTGGQRYRMLERDGIRIAVFAVVHGDLRNDVPSTHLAGVKVADPVERTAEVVAEARQDGADLVVVIAHIDHPSTAPRNAIDLARQIPGIDLIVGSALHAHDERGLALLQFADRATPIVGGDSYAQGLGMASLHVKRIDGHWRLNSIDGRIIPAGQVWPDAQVQRQLAEVHQSYCDEWDEPVGGGRLREPMDATAFAKYLMAVMRWETKSEVAFVHRGMVQPFDVFPAVDAISRHHFFAGIPWRNRLYTFQVKGKALQVLCQRMAASSSEPSESDLLTVGLDCAGGKVNGRVIDSSARYDAVTIDYLAKGAYGYFSITDDLMELYNPKGAEPAPILAELARAFLSGPHFSGPDPAPINASANFPNLYDEVRWRFAGDIDLNVADTTLRPKGYASDESQLDRAEVFSLRGEARGSVAAESSVHGFSADARIKYAQSRTETRDEQGRTSREFAESDDLDTLDVLYRLNALRTDKSSWWAPIPYAGGKIETELTRRDDPEDTAQDPRKLPRHVEVTGTAGARFKFLPELEAKIGAGVRDELNEPEPPAGQTKAGPVFGIEVGYTLKRKSLFSLLGSPLQIESELSTFVSDITGERTLKGTWINRLYVSIGAGIALNVTHDLFFFQKARHDQGWTVAAGEINAGNLGLASQLTLGLSYHADASVQTF